MSYQECPLCSGSGFEGTTICSVCGGFKIIDGSTGLPPNKIITTSTTGEFPSNPSWKNLYDETRTTASNQMEECFKKGEPFLEGRLAVNLTKCTDKRIIEKQDERIAILLNDVKDRDFYIEKLKKFNKEYLDNGQRLHDLVAGYKNVIESKNEEIADLNYILERLQANKSKREEMENLIKIKINK